MEKIQWDEHVQLLGARWLLYDVGNEYFLDTTIEEWAYGRYVRLGTNQWLDIYHPKVGKRYEPVTELPPKQGPAPPRTAVSAKEEGRHGRTVEADSVAAAGGSL